MAAAADASMAPSSKWYDTVEEEDLKEPLPTELNTSSHPRYLAANKDKLTIRYVGKGNHTHDVGAIRANRPCPHRRLLYYYEITVVDAGSRGSIAIGLADGSFELNRQPGWEPNSYAYHGEDGRKYSESERGEAYGPSFAAGDVVGCACARYLPPSPVPPPPRAPPPRLSGAACSSPGARSSSHSTAATSA